MHVAGIPQSQSLGVSGWEVGETVKCRVCSAGRLDNALSDQVDERAPGALVPFQMARGPLPIAGCSLMLSARREASSAQTGMGVYGHGLGMELADWHMKANAVSRSQGTNAVVN